MAKKNVYAVKKGKVPGLFYTWDECKASVDGYPGAEYKGFATKQEAESYLGIAHEENHHGMDIPVGTVVAFVDGSYEHSLLTYSYGCVILTPEGEEITLSDRGENPETAALRNVAGEMLGAMRAVQWAAGKGYHSIRICYDYQGLENWVTGTWKAKTDLTKKYAEYMRGKQGKIDIAFTKIEAHTGNYYNEMADRLAKEALVREE